MWLLPFFYQNMYSWVLVYILNRLYSKNSLFLHFLNSAKLHQKILAQYFFMQTYLVLTSVRILLGCCLSPIHLKTIDFFLDIDSFYNYIPHFCNDNQLILDVKQLNKIMKLHYIYTLKTLWDGQGKIKMH